MYAWTPRDADAFDREPGYLRQAATLAFRILRHQDAGAVWAQLAADTLEWLGADAVRAFRLDADGIPTLAAATGTDAIPTPSRLMELALTEASLVRSRSLISNHPHLHPDLAPLGGQLAVTGSVVHTLLVRAHQETRGIVAVHWITSPRPGYERRAGFLQYWDNAGLAVAISEERAALERTAYVDALTALPNQRALDAAVERHADSHPLGVLVLDFDEVPETHRHVYRGASVGGAAREPGEPIAETLARASRAMHERKRATRSR